MGALLHACAPVLVEAGSQPWSCVLLCLLRQVLNRGAACYRACCRWCSTVGLRAACLLRQVLNRGAACSCAC